MDNPAAGAAGALKKVPKWAWVASAGITGGILFYRHTHSSPAVDTAPAGDATAPGDYGQTYSPLGTVTATPVSNGDFTSPPAGGTDLSQLNDLLGTVGGIYQGAHQNDAPPVGAVDLLNSVLPYVGGGAPSSNVTAAAPAEPYYAPTPPPPPPPPAAPKPVDKCTGTFPYDAGNGDCYRVQCNPPGHAKGRWHFHKNGDAVRVATTC